MRNSILAEGFRYATQTPTVLWLLVLLGGMSVFAMNFQTLLPLFAHFHPGHGRREPTGRLFAVMATWARWPARWCSRSWGSAGHGYHSRPGRGALFLVFELICSA